MPALRELQVAFREAMRDPAAEAAVLGRLEEDVGTGRRRLAAYRNSILGNLIGALAATYPVVERIVGRAFFREATRHYIETHPSVSGDLNDYGGDFAAFLADYPHARELAYLPDVARLEWRVQGVYYAADAPTAELALLAQIPPARYGELRFACDPAHDRLDSPWPLDAIWQVNQEGYAGEMTVDSSRSCRLLILRRQGLVHVEALGPGEAALFDALRDGASLSAAAGQAAVADAGFELGTALRRFVASGLLIRATLGPAAEQPGGSSHG